jgi:hypothetical protein
MKPILHRVAPEFYLMPLVPRRCESLETFGLCLLIAKQKDCASPGRESTLQGAKADLAEEPSNASATLEMQRNPGLHSLDHLSFGFQQQHCDRPPYSKRTFKDAIIPMDDYSSNDLATFAMHDESFAQPQLCQADPSFKPSSGRAK